MGSSRSKEDVLLLSEKTCMGILGTFFSIAIIVAAARITIRFYIWRRIFLDDCFFFVAIAALITSKLFFFRVTPKIYLVVITPHRDLALEGSKSLHGVVGLWTEMYLAEIFAWLTIWSVKFSFLFYFRTLIGRIQPLVILWRCTLVVFVPVACAAVFVGVIGCPYTGADVLAHCISGPSFLHREKAIFYFEVVSDIVTDALLISIPGMLLNKLTRINVTQKISIAMALCMSVVIIAIALVRGISSRYVGTNNDTWDNFWVQLESCVSVIVVCMTAFRSLFTIHSKRSQQKLSPAAEPRYVDNFTPPRRVALFRERVRVLPDIEEGATLTGMRTMIRENGGSVQAPTR